MEMRLRVGSVRRNRKRGEGLTSLELRVVVSHLLVNTMLYLTQSLDVIRSVYANHWSAHLPALDARQKGARPSN